MISGTTQFAHELKNRIEEELVNLRDQLENSQASRSAMADYGNDRYLRGRISALKDVVGEYFSDVYTRIEKSS